MSNIEVEVPAADGSVYEIHPFGESCKIAVETLFTNDFAAPPKYLRIRVNTAQNKMVELIVPYDNVSTATVKVDGRAI